MAGICDVPVISAVCGTASSAAGNLIAGPFNWLADAIAAVAQWLFEGMWALIMDTTSVNVNEPGLLQVYDIVFGIAIFVMLGFFLLQLITGMIHRDPGALSRAGIGLAKSVLGSFVAVTITATLLAIVDELSTGLIQATGNTVDGMGAKLEVFALSIGAVTTAAPGAGALLTIFLGSLMIAGCAILWFSLLIRKALILLSTVMAPIALSGMSWDTTRGWVGKWAGFMLAMIVSKLVVVTIFLIAITQVDSPISLDISSIANPIAGIALLLMAAFAPYLVYKVISFMGFDIYHAMSMEQEAKQAANRPLPLPNMPDTDAVKKVLGNKGDTGSPDSGGDSTPPPGPPDLTPSGTGSPPDTPTPRAGTNSTGGAGTASTGSASQAAGAGAATDGAGAAAGGAAAAGPAAGAVLAAELAQQAATAGPQAGGAVGAGGEAQMSAATDAATPSSTPTAGGPATQTPPLSSPPASPQPPEAAPAGQPNQAPPTQTPPPQTSPPQAPPPGPKPAPTPPTE
ncbi:conjugal transfer protein TrbL [Gryllotalpicola reticulitermitis]|uniref:Conjugal transfer protein TrbL n=1 Tax=Gryllotalpicola reticulitermitis TaxID=1184153 RepID=A0ABV8QBG9_9MICO